MRKYGLSFFTVERVFACDTASDLMQMEKELIRKYETRSPLGYNMTDGGDGTTGLTHTKAAREKIGSYWKGKTRSEETKRKISLAHKGKTLTADHRRKLSDAKVGKHMPVRSELHRARISEGLRKAWLRRKAT
jgi:hypothetical protein